MKRSILTLLVLMQSLCFFAETIQVNGVYYNLIEKGNIAEVISNPQGYSGDIVIQESITHNNNKYNVVGIGENAFLNSTLTSVYIPSSIKEIKTDAFSCQKLETLKISDIESWLNITFYDTPLPRAKHVYINGTEVTDIVIPEGVTELKDLVFYGFTNLKSVSIPSSVVAIGNCAFNNCINVKEISIPNSVTKIGKGAFRYCEGLKSVSLPNGLAVIFSETFAGCHSLKTINMPASLNSIYSMAFAYCI